MKRLLIIAFLLTLPLAGCNQAAPTPDADHKPNDSSGAGASSDVSPSVPTIRVAYTPQTGSLVSSQDVPLLEQINQENVKVLATVLPSIVRITATMPVDIRMEYNGMPFHPPGTGHAQAEGEEAFGSGVVISKDGYIVTNDHVVDGAKTVEVELQDKRTFNAHVVAADTPMDVAVLKIDANDLPALPWGDSDKVQVGEQVFAIGNPFDLEDSASKGIVSAMRRQLPDSPGDGPVYENFIQTDAAINPGNSGGALVNIHGELIGINTAIASTSRGNMGVGFAIPSNMVRYAVEGLIRDGKLVRGYLGVRFPDSVDEGVSDMLRFGSAQGALVAAVMPKSPASDAGLRSGDFITEVDGHAISGIADLRLYVSEIPIGKIVTINYIRDGTAQSTTAKIAELKPDLLGAVNPAGNNDVPPVSTTDEAAPPEDNVLSGLKVVDLTDKDRKKFGIDPIITTGVVVSSVEEGTPADAKSIGPGDVIESVCVDRGTTQTLASAKDFSDLVKSLKPNQDVVLLVHHGASGSFVYLAPPTK